MLRFEQNEIHPSIAAWDRSPRGHRRLHAKSPRVYTIGHILRHELHLMLENFGQVAALALINRVLGG